MAIGLLKRISPEYVLKNAFKDIESSGLDGLKPYLTSNALKKIENIRKVSDGMALFGITFKTQADPDNSSATAVSFLLDKLSEFEFTIKDVLKGSESAKGIVGFKHSDKVEGSVELTLIKEDKEWRIDDLAMPHFDKLRLSDSENK